MRHDRVCLLALAGLALLAPAAGAQTAPSMFLSGGVFASVERDSHVESAFYVYPVLDGTAAGGSVSAGAFLTPRVSVRVEFTFRGDLEDSVSRTETALNPNPVTYTERRTLTDRVRTGSVLLAWHTRNGKRVRFEYTGGIAFVYQRRTSAIETTLSLPGTTPPPNTRSATVTYGTVAVVGLDVPVRVTHRVDVVPQIRAQSTNGLTIRPGVSLRVTF